MHITRYFIILSLISLSSCATSPAPKTTRTPAVNIYHVKDGAEKELELLLARAWKTYQKEGMVFSEPYMLAKTGEEDKERFIEMFVWRREYTTLNCPDSVKYLWRDMAALCEARSGEAAIEFRYAEMFVPRIEESMR
jgi:hypothetical protein